MAVESFTPISWQPDEIITESKMDAIGQNMEFLNERMVKGVYNAHNALVINNIKLAAGIATIEPDPNGATGRDVYFGDFFTTGSRPIVTGTIVTDSIRRIHLTQTGLGSIFPTHTGLRFVVRAAEINPDNNAITKTIYVNWIAVGY